MGSGFCDDKVSNKKRDDGGVVVNNYLNLRDPFMDDPLPVLMPFLLRE